MSEMRLYTVDELGADGYPPAWHESIKHAVREAAGHRCVRCGHPYEQGMGEWSPCDERCTHRGPVRVQLVDGWREMELPADYPVTVPQLLGTYGAVQARARVLTVHHLTGCWGREQDAKRDCRWWNLVAVCQRCHLTLQRKVDLHRVWPWPHSEWFKPYAAGWYAWAYLGEDLKRDAVEARLEELLALERAA